MLYLRHGQFAEVKETGREDRAGAAFIEGGGEVGELAGSATGDHRNRHALTDGAGERHIIARLGAIGIHAGEEDLAGAEFDGLPSPRDGVEFGRVAAAVGVDAPRFAVGFTFGVDREHDALGAEALGRFLDQVRAIDRRGVERNLVGAGP